MKIEMINLADICKRKSPRQLYKGADVNNVVLFQANGKLIIEGVLRVFWGLENPVTLSSPYSQNGRALRFFNVVPPNKLTRSETMKSVFDCALNSKLFMVKALVYHSCHVIPC